jgi:hypothetical protein
MAEGSVDAEAEDSLRPLCAAGVEIADGGNDPVKTWGVAGSEREAEGWGRLAALDRLELQLLEHRVVWSIDCVVNIDVAPAGISKTAADADDGLRGGAGSELRHRIERHVGMTFAPAAHCFIVTRRDDDIGLQTRDLS